MKRIFLIILLLSLALPACADWSITVTWTRSTGPNLASEQVFYNSESKCTVAPTAPTTCNFVSPTLGGSVVIRSTNVQGAYSETAPIVVADTPAPASGVTVNVTYVAP